jgi:hypothetical protein
MPDFDEMPGGALIAMADLVDCSKTIPTGQERWADPNAYHWILDNVVRLPRPIPMRGQLNMWRVARTEVAQTDARLLRRAMERRRVTSLPSETARE